MPRVGVGADVSPWSITNDKNPESRETPETTRFGLFGTLFSGATVVSGDLAAVSSVNSEIPVAISKYM